MLKQTLPIGLDDFEKIRKKAHYYVDKTLMIKEFIEMQDEAALIARPRRFGKTLNMTMIKTFFDITKDSKSIFDKLAIMETPYAALMNSRPVIYLTFKDCKAKTAAGLLELIKKELYQEFLNYEERLREWIKPDSYEGRDFYELIEQLRSPNTPLIPTNRWHQTSNPLLMILHNKIHDTLEIVSLPAAPYFSAEQHW